MNAMLADSHHHLHHTPWNNTSPSPYNEEPLHFFPPFFSGTNPPFSIASLAH